MADAAERITRSLDASLRMALLETLSDAAAEITSVLDGTVIEVRLKGREPQFVVIGAPADDHHIPSPDADEPEDDDDAPTARITLRLPDGLKQRAEEAAGRSRQSLNTWLVEAIRLATARPSVPRPAGRRPTPLRMGPLIAVAVRSDKETAPCTTSPPSTRRG